jgi:hypothetical protein
MENTLVKESFLKHIETEHIQLASFDSNEEYAEFVFCYTENEKKWNILFTIEFVIDTLIVDFEGSELPDSVRLKASKIFEQVIQSIRFLHKDKFWSLSHYYIDDEKEYKKRLERSYPKALKEEWLKMKNMATIEPMDSDDYLFFKVEDIHDLSLRIAGDDGKLLCEVLKELGIIEYAKVALNEYEMQIDEKNELESIKKKMIYEREIAKYGYNIFTDYYEED